MAEKDRSQMDAMLHRQLGGREATPQSRCDRSDPNEISAYVENALPAKHRAEFERHLVRCGECRKTVVALSRLAAAEAGVATQAATAAVATTSPAAAGVILPWRQKVTNSIRRASWLQVAAAAVLLVAVIGPVYLLLWNEQKATQVSEVVDPAKSVPAGGVSVPAPPPPNVTADRIQAPAPSAREKQRNDGTTEARPGAARTGGDAVLSTAGREAVGEEAIPSSNQWVVAVNIDERHAAGAPATLMQAKPTTTKAPEAATPPAQQPEREVAAPAAPPPPAQDQRREQRRDQAKSESYAAAVTASDNNAAWTAYREQVAAIWINELKRGLGPQPRPSETIRFRLIINKRGEIISLQQGRIPAADFLQPSVSNEINSMIATMAGRLKLPPLPPTTIEGVPMIITLQSAGKKQ